MTNQRLHGIRVLVVDDLEEQRELYQTMLERFGAEVATAGSPDDAMGTFVAFRPDVLVVDLALPEGDGFALLERVREVAPEIPVIADSGYYSRDHREMVIGAGFDEFFVRPVTPAKLVDCILSLVDRARS